MRQVVISLALLIGISGCSSHDQYMTNRADATCAVWDRCELLGVIGYEDFDECFNELYDESVESEIIAGGCLDYDSAAAASCVDDLNNMSCDSNFETPSSCLEVCQ